MSRIYRVNHIDADHFELDDVTASETPLERYEALSRVVSNLQTHAGPWNAGEIRAAITQMETIRLRGFQFDPDVRAAALLKQARNFIDILSTDGVGPKLANDISNWIIACSVYSGEE